MLRFKKYNLPYVDSKTVALSSSFTKQRALGSTNCGNLMCTA